jgi:hypothetical protein
MWYDNGKSRSRRLEMTGNKQDISMNPDDLQQNTPRILQSEKEL